MARGLRYRGPMLRLFAALLLLALPLPAAAQELPEGQAKADYDNWLAANPGARASVLSFEAWQQAAGVPGVLPTWQVTRTASMWRECGGQPFEIPPIHHWPGMAATLRFVRDHVRPAIGPVEAVSGYRNPALNQCAGGAANSAHKDYFALDLIPLQPISRLELMRRMCAMHAREGEAAQAGLGFYAFLRFHVDTKGYRRWGSAGPQGNESPCAVIERGEDPTAPPVPAAPLIPPLESQGRGTAAGGGGASLPPPPASPAPVPPPPPESGEPPSKSDQ
jgi:hypothetical protein